MAAERYQSLKPYDWLWAAGCSVSDVLALQGVSRRTLRMGRYQKRNRSLREPGRLVQLPRHSRPVLNGHFESFARRSARYPPGPVEADTEGSNDVFVQQSDRTLFRNCPGRSPSLAYDAQTPRDGLVHVVPSANADLLARLAPSGAEDFITEAFRWVLERTGFGDRFLDRLRGRAVGLPAVGAGCHWETQKSYAVDGTAKRPDMVCESADGRAALIFEHKVGADLHDGQLDSYRRIGRDKYQKHGLVLITARQGDRSHDPDLHLRWREVHVWLSEWLGDGGVDKVDAFIARNLLHLLEERGLGPMEPIKAEQLQTIPRARAAERRVLSLVDSIVDDPFWQELVETAPNPWRAAGNPLVCQRAPKWGRCGIYLVGDGSDRSWNPGLFAGVMLDGSNHRLPSVDDEQGFGPEACVIVSVNRDHHGAYPGNGNYVDLVDTFRRLWPDDAEADHWRCHRGTNRWHPVIVRKPLTAVFGSAATGDEQARVFVEDVGQVAESILGLEELWAFQQALV